MHKSLTLFRQVERFDPAGAISRRLGSACLLSANGGNIGAATNGKVIRAYQAARVRQTLFDSFFAPSLSATILDR
jgi:hypothetical protein